MNNGKRAREDRLEEIDEQRIKKKQKMNAKKRKNDTFDEAYANCQAYIAQIKAGIQEIKEEDKRVFLDGLGLCKATEAVEIVKRKRTGGVVTRKRPMVDVDVSEILKSLLDF